MSIAVGHLAFTLALSLAQGAYAGPVKAASPGAEKARTSPADVETAEQLYAKLDYEQANSVAERVLKQQGLTHDQMVRTYKILAVTHAALDHEEQAKEAFVALLTIDPDYTFDPNLGPKVQGPYQEARGFWRGQTTRPGIDVSAVLHAQEAGSLRVKTRDPTHVVKRVTVSYRWASSGPYLTQTVAAGEATVEVPAPPSGKSRLDYYAQALDERDNVLLEAGNANAPKSAFAEAGRPGVIAGEGKGTIFGSPVFWVITAAVVAGGVTAGYFALRPGTPTSATWSPTLQCGGARCP